MFKNNKTLNLLLIILLCFSLVACTAEEQEDFADESLLIPEEVIYQETNAFIGDFEETNTAIASVVYAYEGSITSESSGYFEEFYVERGDLVSTGDIIASYYTEESQVTLEEKKLEKEHMQSDYDSTVESYLAQIAVQEEALESLEKDSYEYKIQELNLEKVEIQYEQYKYTKELALESLQEEIDNIKDNLELQYIVATFDGEISKLSSMAQGDVVSSKISVAEMVSTDDTYYLIQNSSGFDWGDIVEIELTSTNQTISIYGTVISCGDILSPELGDYPCYIKIDTELSTIPEDFNTLKITSMKAYVTEKYMPDVLLVDKTAVEKDGTDLYVYILEDDTVKTRYITSYNSNDDYYWISDGLSENETIIID